MRTMITNRLRTGLQLLAALAIVIGLLGFYALQSQAAAVPTFTITAVEKDALVTIQTSNFPPNRTFVVRMGKFGTLGVGGTEVATTYSGSGGTFTAAYSIPDTLKGQARIAIRMDATSGGYYSYNWFTNAGSAAAAATATPASASATATPAPTAAVPVPTISVQSVDKGSSVTIQTHNFPAHKTFTARMGAYGTQGVDGSVVGTTDSGSGGTLTAS